MKLTLIGHEYLYAVEQSALNFFPADCEGEAESTLFRGNAFCTGVCRITRDGRTVRASARMRTDDVPDDFERVRREQSAVKHAFYRAAVLLTGEKPAWGALTGIRPAKLTAKLLSDGATRTQAERILEKRYGVSPERRTLSLDCAEAGNHAAQSLTPRDVALYIGIPFCPTRCAYCSFVSLDVHKSGHLKEPFCEALALEMEAAGQAAREKGLQVVTVYWGGGTPTTLSPLQLSNLMQRLAECFDLSAVREYTVEAGRPDTLSPEMLETLAREGATRISVNPQSMNDTVLQGIGRAHTAADVVRAVRQTRDAGIPMLNMDIIAGLPGDTPESFADSLRQVLQMEPENLTVHTLSRKKGSRITLDGAALPLPQEVEAMLDGAARALRENGYKPYYLYRQKYMAGSFENVGWAREGCESLYNMVMMEELATVLSLGAGGASKFVDLKRNRIERAFNPKYAKEYIENSSKICQRWGAYADAF